MARVDITPSQPVKMGGYESRKEPSHGIHDPLGARALALEADGEHLVLVSIDNLGFYNNTAEPLRQGILEACHLKPAELFLCAIHTHSAPILTLDPETGGIANVEYTKTLRAKLIEVVSVALKRLERVQANVSFGSSPVGVNRREVFQQGTEHSKVVLGRNPWRTTDREVQVLKLVAGDSGTTMGALFAYATHSTSLGRTVISSAVIYTGLPSSSLNITTGMISSPRICRGFRKHRSLGPGASGVSNE
jgi:hypothetical protein